MKQHPLQFWLLGATFETKNLGVSALAESSLKCFFTHWPDSEIILQAYSKEPPYQFLVKDKKIEIQRVQFLSGIRCLVKPNSIYKLIAYAFFYKMLPFQGFRNFLKKINPCFQKIIETDVVIDITGGDSFSDLYGIRRLISTSLPKWLFVLCQKKFIFLPQTHGPFRSTLSKWIARYLLNHAVMIYSRDQLGVDRVKELLGHSAEKKVRFIPDVAFVLDPQVFESPLIERLKESKQTGHLLIGLNISGLLYKSKIETQQLFGLEGDYRELIHQIINLFMAYPNTAIVLVPHVFAEGNMNENDIPVCQSVYTEIIQQYPERVFLSGNDIDHKQVKYLIGHCDFFLGARMHACIAAISQCIPALAMAYSGKFIGVFESAGVGEFVVDLRTEDKDKILSHIRHTFEQRTDISEKLRLTIPSLQTQVIEFLGEIHLS